MVPISPAPVCLRDGPDGNHIELLAYDAYGSMTVPVSAHPGLLPLDAQGLRLLFLEARTARRFNDEPVTDEQLRTIAELVRWPPTSANTAPLRIVYVVSAETKARLVPLMDEGNRAKVASAPVTAILAVDTDFHETISQLWPDRPELYTYFAADEDRRRESATFNGALQAGYFVLAVRAVGLAAGLRATVSLGPTATVGVPANVATMNAAQRSRGPVG